MMPEIGDLGVLSTPAYASGGQCLNPHPGAWTESYEEFGDQCWLRVWRVWPDGCAHYQMFNRCSNSFDINEDGSPHVTWTNCVH